MLSLASSAAEVAAVARCVVGVVCICSLRAQVNARLLACRIVIVINKNIFPLYLAGTLCVQCILLDVIVVVVVVVVFAVHVLWWGGSHLLLAVRDTTMNVLHINRTHAGADYRDISVCEQLWMW